MSLILKIIGGYFALIVLGLFLIGVAVYFN